MNRKIVIILIIGFVFRLIALNQSLWLDEGTTARVVKEYTFVQILTQFSPYDFHPPLYYFFMKVWTTLGGYSEAVLRLPSVIFAVATGYIIYLIGSVIDKKRLFIRYTAAAAFLFNPLIVYYSQEARMYMATTFILSCSLYTFIHILHSFPNTYIATTQKSIRQLAEKSKNKSLYLYIVLFNIFVFLAFLTFYGSLFMIMSFYLYLIWKRKFSLLFQLMPGFVLALLILSPLLYQQLMHARASLQAVANWKSVLGTVSLKNLLLIPIKFAFGRISFEPKKLYYSIAGIWTMILFGIALFSGRKERSLLFLFITPLVLGLSFSVFSPLLQYFRFLYLVPLFSLLLAIGLQTRLRDHRYSASLVIIGGFVFLSCLSLFNSQFHRENWKELGRKTVNYQEVYAIPSSLDAFTYYNRYTKITDLRSISARKLANELIIIPYTVEIYGYDYRSLLTAQKYKMYKAYVYRGVTLEYWQYK